MRTKQTITTDQTVEKQVIENRWDRMLIVLTCFFLFVTSVLVGVNTWQGTERNKRIDRIDNIVDDVKQAAEHADQTVKDAVAAQKTPEAKAQARAVIAALGQIQDIKVLLIAHAKLMQEIYGIQKSK